MCTCSVLKTLPIETTFCSIQTYLFVQRLTLFFLSLSWNYSYCPKSVTWSFIDYNAEDNHWWLLVRNQTAFFHVKCNRTEWNRIQMVKWLKPGRNVCNDEIIWKWLWIQIRIRKSPFPKWLISRNRDFSSYYNIVRKKVNIYIDVMIIFSVRCDYVTYTKYQLIYESRCHLFICISAWNFEP